MWIRQRPRHTGDNKSCLLCWFAKSHYDSKNGIFQVCGIDSSYYCTEWELCPSGNKKQLSACGCFVAWRYHREEKEDITSAFHSFFLHRRDQKLITLWLDNCSGQNKNWALFSFLLYIPVIDSPETITDVIRLKYSEPGHTFMSADSFYY